MNNLSEAVQISPIPNKDKTLLVMTAMFSKTIFYEVGVQSFFRIDSLDIEKFCKFINAVNQKYNTSYIYDMNMYYGTDIYQFIEVTDEESFIKTELINIGQKLMEKFISKLQIDDKGNIPVHKTVSFTDFQKNGYQFDYTRWIYDSTLTYTQADDFIIIYGEVHPSNIDWATSIMYAIYKPEVKLLITENNIPSITGLHTSEFTF